MTLNISSLEWQNSVWDNFTSTVNNSLTTTVNSSYVNYSTSPSCLHPDNRTMIEFYTAHIPVVMKIYYILPPIWWLIGIIGNILALLVWLQPKMRHSSGCYLAALAITDLCFLPLNIVYEINHTYSHSILDKPIVCQWYAVTYLTVQYMSPVLVLAFTVERYLSVCHPFRMVKFNQSNIRVTLLVIFGLLLFCVGLNGVQAYFWTTDHGEGESICNLREEILTTQVWMITTWSLEALIFAVVPLTVLILNILVIIEVRNISSLERQNMRTNSIDHRSTTLMLLGVSFYLIFTVLPVTITYALYYLYSDLNRNEACLSDDEMRKDEKWVSFFNYMSARIIIQNFGMSHYAANFFIYLSTGKLFRKQLKELVVMFCCKERLPNLFSKTGVFTNTRTTRMSLTSHRGSVGRGRLHGLKMNSDQCNNDTELGNKNISDLYSAIDINSSCLNGGHGIKNSSTAGSKLLTCVEESDAEISDREEGQFSPALRLT